MILRVCELNEFKNEREKRAKVATKNRQNRHLAEFRKKISNETLLCNSHLRGLAKFRQVAI